MSHCQAHKIGLKHRHDRYTWLGCVAGMPLSGAKPRQIEASLATKENRKEVINRPEASAILSNSASSR